MHCDAIQRGFGGGFVGGGGREVLNAMGRQSEKRIAGVFGHNTHGNRERRNALEQWAAGAFLPAPGNQLVHRD